MAANRPSSLHPIPDYLSHYYERSAGPLKNICDLSDADIARIREHELSQNIEFSRFRIWPRFMESRRAADDLLMDLYQMKFRKRPAFRPVYAVLGDFHKIPGLFADPGRIRVEIADLVPEDVTFMYPDHAHLIQYFDHDSPPFGAALPEDYCKDKMPYYGKLFTYEELKSKHVEYGISSRIEQYLDAPENFVYSYVEAHIWRRDIRFTQC